jgi:hypothetical protein
MKKGGWRWDQKDITFANLQFYFSTDSANAAGKVIYTSTRERELGKCIKRLTDKQGWYSFVKTCPCYTQYLIR